MNQGIIPDLQLGKKLIQEGNRKGLPEKKIALLGTYTLNYLQPLLTCAFHREGFFAPVHLTDFNQWRQEILNPGSALYAFKPDAAIFAPTLEDLLPALFDNPEMEKKEQDRIVMDCLESIRKSIETLASRLPQAAFYLVIPSLDQFPGEIVADPTDPFRAQNALTDFQAQLREMSRQYSQVVCVDWDWHTRAQGYGRNQDDRLWYMARMRLSLEGLNALAQLIVYYFQLNNSPRSKVVIVDLDNTLWGGVAGEDGWQNLELGHEGVGLAFRDFQRELLKLQKAGLLLAICSKNDEATAWEVFGNNPNMILKREHFAAYRINWADKAENIRSLMKELNLGVENAVFLDDDPVQRAAARSQLPLQVPELPADPCHRPRFLRQCKILHRPKLTLEDTKRTQLYRHEAKREEMKIQASSLEDFLASLKQEAKIILLNKETLPRAAQLCQKTNQFNLTTKRYGPADLEAILRDPSTEAYTLSLKDIFGDNGIVGLALLRYRDGEAEIDTFLMSCRILGRKVETSLLAHLAERASQRGAKLLAGRYIATEKNSQVRDFYPNHGFKEGPNPSIFHLDLKCQKVKYPKEISLIFPSETHAKEN